MPGLTALAVLSVWRSGLAPLPAALAALVAAGWGGYALWRECRRPRRSLWIPGDGRAVEVDGRPVAAFQVAWRGPLALLSWRDGRRRKRVLFWPDTLSPPQRRELRLAAGAHAISSGTRQMAP